MADDDDDDDDVHLFVKPQYLTIYVEAPQSGIKVYVMLNCSVHLVICNNGESRRYVTSLTCL